MIVLMVRWFNCLIAIEANNQTIPQSINLIGKIVMLINLLLLHQRQLHPSSILQQIITHIHTGSKMINIGVYF